jgi:hypothetical protein
LLDRLLEAADWPETPPLVLARLQMQWRDLSPARLARRRRRRWLAAAAAAAALLAGIFVWWPSGEQPVEPRMADQAQQERLPVKQPSAAVDDPRPESPTETARAGSSEQQETTPRPRTRRQWLAYRKRVDVSLNQAVNELATTAGWTAAQLAATVEPLRVERDYCIRRLAEQVVNREGPARRAALDLLVELADNQVNIGPVLTRLATIPECHAAALRALAPQADSATLAAYVRREKDTSLQQYMLHQLVQRKDLPSVGLFLDLVADMNTRRQALQALNRVEAKPTTMLLGYLQRGNPVRSSAAMLALAELDDPQVVPLLSRLVLANVDRQAALMTLMARADKQSLSLLRQLARAPAFTSDLLSARNRLATMVVVNRTAAQEI